MKLYTKTGDEGMSGLASGVRLPKNDVVFELLGSIDETNSHIGVVISAIETTPLRHELMAIQDDLLMIGAVVAGSKKVVWDDVRTRELEQRIDAYQKEFGEGWYTKFLLPGGSPVAAQLDVARTVCRRTERVFVAFHQDRPELSAVLRYINRLSDYLFALRCSINHAMHYEETEFHPKYLEMMKG